MQNKKGDAVVIAIIIVIVAITAGVIGWMFAKKSQTPPRQEKVEISSFEDYYGDLAKQCEQEASFGCCIESVRAMKDGNYKLIKNDTCGDGFMPSMLKCIGSFKWCEPIKK